MKLHKLYIYSCLLLCYASCIPTDTARVNSDERIFCEMKSQHSSMDNSVKAEVSFYAQDSVSRRPYFLGKDVFFGSSPMIKKFVGNKGVFYTATQPKEKAFLNFTNLDGKEYRIDIPEKKVDEIKTGTYPLEEILNWSKENTKGTILLEKNGKLLELPISNKGSSLLGEARLLQVEEQDSTYQLGGKMWIKHNHKFLSSPIDVVLIK